MLKGVPERRAVKRKWVVGYNGGGKDADIENLNHFSHRRMERTRRSACLAAATDERFIGTACDSW